MFELPSLSGGGGGAGAGGGVSQLESCETGGLWEVFYLKLQREKVLFRLESEEPSIQSLQQCRVNN